MMDEKSSAVQLEDKKFNLKRFCSEVKAELKKVSWSSRKELVSYTCVVALAVVIVCSLIWVCDTVFARVFQMILR